ncbi:hypothetical protein PBY51_017299 [Eleginops maclovinus]|uniref:Uncharacterized protein n=1 Tax=Eleginops maclovinus TaxID=56733 RepID=A0AAN7XJK6_ELEMC|nr:hypothetical protein PBY51_017299 [Eleginops maclovinus]
MGPRLLFLLVLTLLIFTDHSQGVPKTHEQSLDVSRFPDAPVFEPLTIANPINIPRQHTRPCNCKGKEMKTLCLCQQSGRRTSRNGKWKSQCQNKKNKNLKKCRKLSKPIKGSKTRNLGPSVPI